MSPVSTILSTMVLAGALCAQQNIVWNDNSTPTGGGNAFPWGSAGIRYQNIVSNAVLGNTPAVIQDIFVAGDATALRELVYDDIEIRMGMTAQLTATTAWATNNPAPTTVYRGYLRVVFEPGVWRGIGLPASYLYVPTPAAPNLCVEVIVWAVRGVTPPSNFFFPASGSQNRAFLYNWINLQTNAPNAGTGASKIGLLIRDGNYVLVGAGCNSSASTQVTINGPGNAWPTLGMPFPISLTGGAPSRPLFLAIGGTDLANPIDLGIIGAPSCFVWNDLPLALGFVSNGSGNATLPLGIPNSPPFPGLRLFSFWAQLDPAANVAGLTTSGQMKLIISQ